MVCTYTYLCEVKEEVVGAAYTRLLGTELAARGLELHRVDQLATLITLVTTGILSVERTQNHSK